MSRALLITGGAGFIGSNFSHYWLTTHPNDTVVVLDALTYAGNLSSLARCKAKANFHFVKGSIGDRALVVDLLKHHHIDTVVNFAAESHVDRSINSAKPFIDTNVVGTLSLLEAAKQVWLDKGVKAHHFHHVSTDEVYGSLEPDEPAFTEQHQYQPNSPYSASKAASDHLVRAFHHTYGLNVTTSNCSNNYGAYHYPEKLIPLIILNILHNTPLPVYGDGKQIRDWLHVSDHCKAIEQVLLKGQYGEVYNIGGNNEWQNIEIVKYICQHLNTQFTQHPELALRFPKAQYAKRGNAEKLITFVADRLGHDTRYAINTNKAALQLDYYPDYNFEQGLAQTIQWYLANPNWWQPLYKTTQN